MYQEQVKTYMKCVAALVAVTGYTLRSRSSLERRRGVVIILVFARLLVHTPERLLDVVLAKRANVDNAVGPVQTPSVSLSLRY